MYAPNAHGLKPGALIRVPFRDRRGTVGPDSDWVSNATVLGTALKGAVLFCWRISSELSVEGCCAKR